MLQRGKNLGFKPPSNSQYFTATVPHTTLWDTTQITSILCSMVLKRHNSRYYHFSKLLRTFKIGLAASLQILGHFCIPELQFSTCSGDLACPWTSKAEQRRAVCMNPCAGCASPWTTFGVLPPNAARGEGDAAMKCAQKLENTNSKAAFPPFSSTLNVSMENSF